MPRLFGTDGIRGTANRDLTPDLVLTLGRAAGIALASDGGRAVLGRDTRISGPMLEAALVAGLCSAGVDVALAGIIPTPAVAHLTVQDKADLGGMVSASHNPVPDNGVKFFSADGVKVTTAIEDEIERLMTSPPEAPAGGRIGSVEVLHDAEARYFDHLASAADGSLAGLKVVLDCAFGAAWQVAPRAFEAAGADVVPLHAEPDGTRINVDCGSTSLTTLARTVVDEGADLGLAFDGDADRVLAVDENGDAVDGDRILALNALRLLEAGTLDHHVVVVTVMSNLGLRRALEDRGIEVVTTPVGDRVVAAAMNERGAALGGEQSGHVIWARHSTTGDGVLTGLQTAAAVAASGEALSRLAHVFEPYPQVLINVPADRTKLEGCRELWDEVAGLEDRLGAEGRVLLRPSGTEPIVRVMVEAADAGVAEREARRLADLVERLLA